jgi:hypothetical protein
MTNKEGKKHEEKKDKKKFTEAKVERTEPWPDPPKDKKEKAKE